MIDRKKLINRVSRSGRVPEYPLLNLYTLVAVVAVAIGQGLSWHFIVWLRPLPEAMMALYLARKNIYGN